MSVRNRVIWNEGLFIKPQHFQQQQRYHEYLLETRVGAVSQYLYGLTEISLNPEYLSFGRIALDSAAGIMPDGTAFHIPRDDLLPEPLDVRDSSEVNQTIYLALPIRSDSMLEVDRREAVGTGRYQGVTRMLRDIHTPEGDNTAIELAPVRLRLMLEREDRSAFASMAIARIREKRPDGSVVLDRDFAPCHLNVATVPHLHRFVSEMAGLMRERASTIARRLGSPGQGSVADVTDFMLLQALNRMQPQLEHLSRLRSLHPERLFEVLTMMCGELATFTDESRMAPTLLQYHHDLPELPFHGVMTLMRQLLSIVLDPRAVSIQLHQRPHGLVVAPLQDPTLLQAADFVLAVRADMPMEALRQRFTQQTKVASVEKIRELVALQLSGIPLVPMPVAPAQLPYHAGYTYFQLDKGSPAWASLSGGSGFAFHVAGGFPGLDLQFWAIRS